MTKKRRKPVILGLPLSDRSWMAASASIDYRNGFVHDNLCIYNSSDGNKREEDHDMGVNHKIDIRVYYYII